MSQDNTHAYVMNQEAMEEIGGEETVVRIYRENTNPKKDGIGKDFHTLTNHVFWEGQLGKGNCIHCAYGSKPIPDSEYMEMVK